MATAHNWYRSLDCQVLLFSLQLSYVAKVKIYQTKIQEYWQGKNEVELMCGVKCSLLSPVT